jgi:predicted nucleic-acid-binding Zn-ribbon protein
MTEPCVRCGSSNLKELQAEISFAQGKAPPVYTLQKSVVCLDCGFTECVVPKASLARIKENCAAPSRSSR